MRRTPLQVLSTKLSLIALLLNLIVLVSILSSFILLLMAFSHLLSISFSEWKCSLLSPILIAHSQRIFQMRWVDSRINIVKRQCNPTFFLPFPSLKLAKQHPRMVPNLMQGQEISLFNHMSLAAPQITLEANDLSHSRRMCSIFLGSPQSSHLPLFSKFGMFSQKSLIL